MKKEIPSFHIQPTQAFEGNVEVTLMFSSTQFTFYTTEDKLDTIPEKLQEEIKSYRENKL